MLTLGISEQRRELRFGVGSGFKAGSDLHARARSALSSTCNARPRPEERANAEAALKRRRRRSGRQHLGKSKAASLNEGEAEAEGSGSRAPHAVRRIEGVRGVGLQGGMELGQVFGLEFFCL